MLPALSRGTGQRPWHLRTGTSLPPSCAPPPPDILLCPLTPQVTFPDPSARHSSQCPGPPPRALPGRVPGAYVNGSCPSFQETWDCWLTGSVLPLPEPHPRPGRCSEYPRPSPCLPALPFPPYSSPFYHLLLPPSPSSPFFLLLMGGGAAVLSLPENSQNPSRTGDVPGLSRVEGLCSMTLGKSPCLWGPHTLTSEME